MMCLTGRSLTDIGLHSSSFPRICGFGIWEQSLCKRSIGVRPMSSLMSSMICKPVTPLQQSQNYVQPPRPARFIMIEAEQYFSAESSTARATFDFSEAFAC